jgi:hypothetical protein
MPILAPIVAWLAGLSTEAVVGWTLFGLGASGIAANTYEKVNKTSKEFTQSSLIPAAIIAGVVYYFVNKSKK